MGRTAETKEMRHRTSLMACLLALAPLIVLVAALRAPADAIVPSRDAAQSAVGPRSVVINEVAWMGTAASHTDEWIELFNNTDEDIDLTGWALLAADGTPDIALSGIISAHGYFLLERTDDDTVRDIPADLIYTGALQNNPAAEILTLYSDTGQVIDTANIEGGPWPAGDNATKRTMERIDPLGPDQEENWCTNDGITRNGKDANGDPIDGTPRAQNSCYQAPAPSLAHLAIAKDGPPAARPGDPITYHITLENAGTATAVGVLLTDTLPADVTFVTQTSPYTFTAIGEHVVWQCGDLPVGTTSGITVVGRVTETASGSIVNVITATASQTVQTAYRAVHTATLRSGTELHLPLVARQYRPPLYGVILEAVLYDGLQPYDYDEAVLVLNGYDVTVDVSGWRLCTWHVSDWRCADLPSVNLAPGQRVWLTRCDQAFARSFGFPPDYVLSSWPRFANAGGEVALLDAQDAVRDLLVYRDGETDLDGWEGPSLEPYRGTNFALRGQVLYRYLDEETGLPAADTDTAADWAQYPHDPHYGRRVRYPGWSLETFFHPAVGASGTVTAGIAPDNAYDLVVDTIRAARETIEIEAYSMRHYGLTMELIERAQQGVTVTVLLEGGPVGGLPDQQLWVCEQLHATGRATCAFMVNDPDDRGVRSRYRFLHAKFMIVDRERLLISSQNFNHSGLPDDDKSNGTGGSRGIVLVTDAPEMVARAVEVFEADFDPVNHVDLTIWAHDNELGYGAPPSGFVPYPGEDWITYTVRFTDTMVSQGTWFELITAPEASLRSRDALLGLVARAGAGDAVFVQQLYERPDWGDPVSSPNLRLQAYVEAARRGARVRILINGGYFDLEYLPLIEEAEAVAAVNEIAASEGLDMSARMGDPTQYGIHNKMVLVDLQERGQYAHIGSINGSETANKVNREMAIQVRSADLFSYLYEVFAHDWEHEAPQAHVLAEEGERDRGVEHARSSPVPLFSREVGPGSFASYLPAPVVLAERITSWR